MIKKTLYQESSKGNVKFVRISSNASGEMITEWGILEGKTQSVAKQCKGLNVGKSNETTPAQQADKEALAKIKEKMENGYGESIPSLGEAKTTGNLDLDNLPKSFVPCKPDLQDKLPKEAFDTEGATVSIKRNGHCIILVKGATKDKVYSRTMEDITEYAKDLPVVKDMLFAMPVNAMILTEFTVSEKIGEVLVDSARAAAKVIRKKDAKEALKRYNEFIASGNIIQLTCLDIMFHDNKFCGDLPYNTRLNKINLIINELITHNINKNVVLPTMYPASVMKDKAFIQKHKQQKYEGFVIRIPGRDQIKYSLDGTADRAGSFKWKFTHTQDFIVVAAEKGLSGKHAQFYSQFFIYQMNNNKEMISCGKAGPGQLSHEELTELTKNIDAGKIKLPFVVEIEFQSRHADSSKIEFPIIQRLRLDKNPKECFIGE